MVNLHKIHFSGQNIYLSIIQTSTRICLLFCIYLICNRYFKSSNNLFFIDKMQNSYQTFFSRFLNNIMQISYIVIIILQLKIYIFQNCFFASIINNNIYTYIMTYFLWVGEGQIEMNGSPRLFHLRKPRILHFWDPSKSHLLKSRWKWKSAKF